MALRFRTVVCSVLFFSISLAVPANAEPVRVTSGQFIKAWDDPSYFMFYGEDFALWSLFVGVFVSPQFVCFTGCLPGTVVDMSSVAGGDSRVGILGESYTAIINGVTFTNHDNPDGLPHTVNLSGTLHFAAGSVVIPPWDPEVPLIELPAPFQLEGQVIGFARSDLEGRAPLFQVELNGQGTARMTMHALSGGTFGAPEITYTFTESPPIPEPATMLLCGTGISALMLSRRRKLRAPRA